MDKNRKILLIEDDKALAMGTKYSLQTEGMQVTEVCDFASAKEAYQKESAFDLILLDVMLPDGDGYEICQWFKERNPALPIIFLTALDDEGNVVHGLEVGGDDYVTKPFRTKELIARIHANIRKAGCRNDYSVLHCGGFRLDEHNYALWKDSERIDVTPSEFRLLRELMKHQGQILTREQLIDKLWSVDEAFVDDNTLSVYIRRIREKIDEDGEESQIKTVRGIGYTWRI